jgi:lauroyl/myristoyl acyltransferase
MKSSYESFLCGALKALGKVFCFLPYQLNLTLAKGIGTILSIILSKKRKVVEANLRTALCDQMSPEAIRRLSRQVFQNFAANFMDLLCLPKIKAQGFEKTVVLEGREHIEKLWQAARDASF